MNLKCFIGFFFIISSVCNAEVTSDLWHREFVQSWNEWQRTQKVPPYLAKNDLLKTLMKKVKDSAKYKQEDKNAPSYLLASTSSGIVNFTSTTKTFPRSIVEVEKDKTQHRLTIRLLKWPKFLMNGNTFEYYPKQSIKENLTILSISLSGIDAIDKSEFETEDERIDAEFALITAECSAFINALIKSLGGDAK